jgi:hypothetical protein
MNRPKDHSNFLEAMPVVAISANRGTAQREIDLVWVQRALNNAFIRQDTRSDPVRSTSQEMLHKWQSETNEWYDDPVLEILEEYEEWRSKQTVGNGDDV